MVSDKNLINEKIIEIRRRPSCSYQWICAFKHSLSISLPLAVVTVTEINTLSERLIFVHLITFALKTTLYEKKFKKTLNQRKLVRLIKNTISQSLLFTQWRIRSTSRYNVTLFLSISMIFLHSSTIACNSWDNNSTRPGFTSIAKKLPVTITLDQWFSSSTCGTHTYHSWYVMHFQVVRSSFFQVVRSKTWQNVQLIFCCWKLWLNTIANLL